MNVPFTARPGVQEAPQFETSPLAPPLQRRRLQCYLALMVADILAIAIAFAVSGYFYSGGFGLERAFGLSQILLPVYLTVALNNSAYSIDSLRDVWHGIVRSQGALLIAVCGIVLIAFYAKSSFDYSRGLFTTGILASMALLLWFRLQMRSFVHWRCGAKVTNELLIDDGGSAGEFRDVMRVSATAMHLSPNLNDPFALDRFGLVLRNIDRVIVSCPPERRVAWSMMLKGTNVEGEVLDDQVVVLGAQGARVVDGKHGLLLVSVGPLGLRARAAKRLFDLVIAGAAIVVLAPMFLAVALAIKLEDGGPLFFVQRRMGRGNRFFGVYKFRSMAESDTDSDGLISVSRHDQRVTRVGRWIRKTSIDELPQLFNVLMGDMSLVGPRPHAIGSQAGEKLFWEVDLRYWQRHSLKPGLSGLAQVRGFRGATLNESDLVERLQSDLEYLEGWTILRDVKILLLTLRVLMHDRAF